MFLLELFSNNDSLVRPGSTPSRRATRLQAEGRAISDTHGFPCAFDTPGHLLTCSNQVSMNRRDDTIDYFLQGPFQIRLKEALSCRSITWSGEIFLPFEPFINQSLIIVIYHTSETWQGLLLNIYLFPRNIFWFRIFFWFWDSGRSGLFLTFLVRVSFDTKLFFQSRLIHIMGPARKLGLYLSSGG